MAGLVIETLDRQGASADRSPSLVADRRLFTDVTQQVVLEEGDIRAAFVLCGPGSTIPSLTVKRLGLAMVDGRVVQRAPEQKELAPPTENKQAARPKENKAKGRR